MPTPGRAPHFAARGVVGAPSSGLASAPSLSGAMSLAALAAVAPARSGALAPVPRVAPPRARPPGPRRRCASRLRHPRLRPVFVRADPSEGSSAPSSDAAPLPPSPSRSAPRRLPPRPPAAFALDDALSAWILARFAFIWFVCGYVAVPAYALARGVQPPGALPPAELALGLLAGETAKTLATLAMLRAELGAAPGGVERHAPWANRRYDPTRDWWDGEEEERSEDDAAEAEAAEAEAEAEAFTPTPLSLPPRVASAGVGVGFGALASVLARLADAVALGGEPAVDAAQSSIASEAQIDVALTSLLDPSLGVLPPACLAVTSLALAPGLEELVFRGFALPAVERRVANRYVSTAIVAAAFAAAHLGSSGAEKIQLFLAACCFGGAFWTTRGGLVAPTAAHAAFNLGVLLETRAKYH